MKFNTLVIVGVAAVVLFNLVNLGVAGNVLQFYIQSVDFTGLTTGRIVLMVQNPSNANITLNSMAGTVSANGTTIGNVSNFQGGVFIPANQQVPVTVFVNVSLTGIFSELYTQLTQPTGQNQIAFVIAGNMNINAGGLIPFNVTQTVGV